MRRAWLLSAVVLAVAAMAAPALAQDQWVRGPVTAMTGDTLTVNVKGVATTFKVEKATRLIARGAGTAAREADAAGKPGPKLGEFVKVGQSVEVHYKDAAGTKMATLVRPLATGDEASPEEPAGSSVTGTVVSVQGGSLIVKADGKDMTFAVTPKTRVVGTGMGTKSRELASAGKPRALGEFLEPNDQVIVYFTEGTTPTATGVRLVQRPVK